MNAVLGLEADIQNLMRKGFPFAEVIIMDEMEITGNDG